MKPSFVDRRFLYHLEQPNVDWRVLSYSHKAVGGPLEAVLEARGDDLDLWQLVNLLRAGVTILTDEGDPAWWGYVSKIELEVRHPSTPDIGRITCGVDLDGMYNFVRVAYTRLDTGTGEETGDRTDWTYDDVSYTEYGIKELIWSCDAATETHALAARNARLEQAKLPMPIFGRSEGAKESKATLTCRGWWGALDWRYYANAGTADVDTATQAGAIATARGQFFSGVYVDVLSGITISEERDGDGSALYEVERLLNMGTTNYRRMLAAVDQNRAVRIYEEPAWNVTPLLLTLDGQVYTSYGAWIRPQVCPVGAWARLKDAIPDGVNVSRLGDPSRVFIEQTEFDVEKNQLTVHGRGALDPWEFPITKEG